MAIDTENKRRSVQACFMGAMRPIADGAVTAPDRATCAWFYSGLTYALEIPVEAVASLLFKRRRDWGIASTRLRR